MAFVDRAAEVIRLVPHSGIQFLTFGLNINTASPFARSFIGYKFPEQARPDGTVPMELQPGWNEDDLEGEPPYEPRDGLDETYRVNKERAIDTFLDRWIPMPFLSVRPGLDAQGREILDAGPIDWARLRLFSAEPGTKFNESEISHYAVFAFDTEIVEREPGRYVGPTAENVKDEQEFAFATRFSDVTRFLALGGAEQHVAEKARVMSWVDRWLFEAYVASRERQTNRRMREEEKKTIEHLARYVTLVQFISTVVPIPRIRLVDTYSDTRRTKPVAVDLVLDVGNSRTCGILIETYPNDSHVTFANTVVLGLRDLSEPYRIYREPFESHIEFSEARFGFAGLSKQVRRKSGFFWPSPVRIGREASRFRALAEGTEQASGMSSPKRYLCDLNPVNQEWHFQAEDYDADQNPPLVANRLYQFVNARGDVKRQVADEKQLYSTLAASIGMSADGATPSGLSFSRSSIFTFMLCEIVAQAWSMVNSPEFRKERRERDAPRELRRIFLSLPTAMPVQEQRIMRSRAHAAVKLMWDMMGWTANPPPNLHDAPEVRISLDEATCSQLVYLYNEIVEKFGGNIREFFDLVGRPRPFVDPEQPRTVTIDTDPNRSLRIASIDVGGGTTDLMITTYHIQGDRALVPIQNFREGFRIAGDDMLREVIQQAVLQPLERQLHQAGIASPREFLNDRFGSNKANMPIQEQHLRRQFVLSVLQPAGLAAIKLAEAADFESEERIESTTLGALLGAAEGKPALPSRIREYVEGEARRWGAPSFSLEACPISINIARVRSAVSSALGEVFDNLAEAINHFACDLVILSGRPSRLPATIDLFADKLAISPDRLVPLSRYQVGKWYPFASRSSRIDDPKTATAVGCLLGCLLAERQVTNFTVYTNRFGMRSTAKYIGQLQNDGKLPADKVYFKWSDDPKVAAAEDVKIAYDAPMRLGYRQLPIERWTATPLYRLKLNAGASKERIQWPVTVELGRKPIDEIADVDDLKLPEKEAMKEELQLRDAYSRDGGGGMKRLFSLALETLPSEESYWLDTGILTVS